MDGLLVIDKPVGPTSHDVVARVRRLLREKRIGHTGTLDPMASGVLPLVLGRATRLARFITAGEKRYVAVVTLGVSTDTYDAMGQQVGPIWSGAWPDAERIDRALDPFRGAFMQQPPAYSAKKIDGERSYRLARRSRTAEIPAEGAAPVVVAPKVPAAAPVSTSILRLERTEGAEVTLDIACSSGFYVRSLAHDLGQSLGTGAHLSSLRRTGSGGVGLADATPLTDLEGPDGEPRAASAVIPIERMLSDWHAVTLTAEGAERVGRGQDIGPEHADAGFADPATVGSIRLRSADGRLLAIAEAQTTTGLLHPAIVLI